MTKNKVTVAAAISLFLFFLVTGFINISEPNFIERIHFPSNHYQITASEIALLEQNIVWMKNHPAAVFILEGHCDEWGEDEYNLELGDKRAREVKAYLIEQGVDPERIILVVSYGEKRPLDSRKFKDAWAANRRVEFVLR